MAQTIPTRVRLGEFELNLETGQLRSLDPSTGGTTMVLREQPFQILKLLVERAGRIVTREDIKNVLWPNDTIVDFDHSISVAIRILRKAFGDSAQQPKYIETIASRGYCLLIAVEYQETSSGAASRKLHEEVSKGNGHYAGTKVSHYRVLEVLGGGGMGVVYRGEDLKLGRPVALKFLPPEVGDNPGALKRFEQEARLASALNHPNICTIYEIDEHRGQPFIAMELLEGETLRHRLNASESIPLSLTELMSLADQVCRGLQAAHEKGIIHRDIKPGNIFLTTSGTAKILDFGVAKLTAREEGMAEGSPSLPEYSQDGALRDKSEVYGSLTTTGSALGTAGYMSPEQVRKENLDSRSDLFSFGATLYEAATGRRAFTGPTEDAVREAILHSSPVPVRDLNPEMPRRFDGIISKALEKDRDVRYQSATEIREDVESLRSKVGPKRIGRGLWFAGAAAILMVIVGIWLLAKRHSQPIISAGDTVVLSVVNQTGDPVFDEALYSASLIALQQTPYINVLGSYKVSDLLNELHLSAAPWIAPQVARQICLRTASRLVIASSIAGLGNGFRVETAGMDCQSGKEVASVQQRVAGRSDIFRALGLCLVQLRRKLGEPASSISKFNQPLETATSASPEALQLLTDGYIRQLAGDYVSALSDYQRAVAVDPQLALGYAAAAVVHDHAGDRTAAAKASSKAYDLRDRLTLPGRFHVEQVYYENALGDLERACAVLAEWVHTFPADFIARNNHSYCLVRLGRPDEALAEAREAARLFPSTFSYGQWIGRSIQANRLDEAMAVFESAQQRHFDGALLRAERSNLAFLQRDDKTLQQQLDWARGKPSEPGFLETKAWIQAYYGHHREALRLLRRVKEFDADKASAGCQEDFNATMALWDVQQGFTQDALQIVKESLPSREISGQRFRFALAAALAGSVDQAQSIANEARREFPQDTSVQNYQLPVIEAAIKLHQNDPRGAVDLLQRTLPYDLSTNCNYIDSLQSAYIRGQAYLRMKQGEAALVEFQKLQDNPGIVAMAPIGAMAKLQIARAYILMGNDVAARDYYEQFLSLWKDADPEIPIYRQAKAEYAQLRLPTITKKSLR